MHRSKLISVLCSGLLAGGTATALADESVREQRLDVRGDRIEERLDDKGDRVEQRLDHKGDRINKRLDRRGERATRRRS